METDEGNTRDIAWVTDDGRRVTKAHLRMSYRGTLQLYATIDGEEKRAFITRTKPEYAEAIRVGIAHLPEDTLRQWVTQYLLS